ncbi:DNA repair protein RAD10 [Kluyveromyces marxianus]|uniref:DNA repair protein RAD10 n=2 Tax=Kluyveromyces marxianus TaxID=4911 RepID=W0T674_KLUMD|nr:DNA repair protein RAD10 [Kluyveromyces marxianus DMKU3-1042]QGN14850.1 DNA repair protein RAD10 [Kluyveromyces marxianus]BAO39122.1 DNA repair protein RAD10 [Kluyveromyces marxianus DMKU3-1042]BAP70640.1 DNA repair protein RAD10 [Kluyveromyces marxianus]
MSDDTTSFESILANVRKRRAEFEQPNLTPVQQQQGLGSQPQPQAVSKNSTESNAKYTSTNQGSKPIVNSFNQQHDDSNGNNIIIHNQRKANTSQTLNNAASASKTMFVSSSQTGNPLLKSLVNVNWRYVKSTPTAPVNYDYQIRGRNVVFLSLRYHKLHPEYIGKKLLPFRRSEGNILLCVVDVENSEDILRELNKVCMFQGFTMLLAFSFEQAGNYLTFMNK